ncbi:prisilkin-39-like [Schistocerca cancellata]|uniref:prisilkin-39-like n=1 Tax=Schistocerca cancellata TaxID=274614 RepID=UPI0021192108|nr:prisilkin-39-like [Schistocerca cancellata]
MSVYLIVLQVCLLAVACLALLCGCEASYPLAVSHGHGYYPHSYKYPGHGYYPYSYKYPGYGYNTGKHGYGSYGYAGHGYPVRGYNSHYSYPAHGYGSHYSYPVYSHQGYGYGYNHGCRLKGPLVGRAFAWCVSALCRDPLLNIND